MNTMAAKLLARCSEPCSLLRYFSEMQIEPSSCVLEERMAYEFKFLPDITRSWMCGKIYENRREGTRVSHLVLNRKDDPTLFNELSSTQTIGLFVKALEESICKRTFDYCALVSHTVWSKNPDDENDGDLNIAVFTLPRDAFQKMSPDKILKRWALDMGILRLFSQKFRDEFLFSAENTICRIGEKLEAKPVIAQMEIRPRSARPLLIVPSMMSGIKFFEISDSAGNYVTLMRNKERRFSIQSFRASPYRVFQILGGVLGAL